MIRRTLASFQGSITSGGRSRLVAFPTLVLISAFVASGGGCASSPAETDDQTITPEVRAAMDAQEVREMIREMAVAANRDNRPRAVIADEGSLEFWSSGGLLHLVSSEEVMPRFEDRNLVPKHIEVVSLVPGEAVVAMFYEEGTAMIAGSPAIDHFLTRVTEVFVKQDGEWRLRAAHASPMRGGRGTTSTAVDVVRPVEDDDEE